MLSTNRAQGRWWKRWNENKGSNFSQEIKGNKSKNAKGPYKDNKNGNASKTQQRLRLPNDSKPNEKTKRIKVE